jgi:hypothetical protein
MEDVHAVDESDARARLVCRGRAPGGGGVRRDRSADRADARADQEATLRAFVAGCEAI